MAEYMAISSNIKLQARGSVLEEQFFRVNTSNVAARRIVLRGSWRVNHSSTAKAYKLNFPHLRILNRSMKRASLIKCCCLSGGLLNVDRAITSNWVPVMDQVLLLASVTLTYMAGVIPVGKSLYYNNNNNKTSISHADVDNENSSFAGSEIANEDNVSLQFAWDVVKRKLLDSLSAVNGGVGLSERVAESEQNRVKRPSSLAAIAEGPRLRLLWASFQCLNKEVANISSNAAILSKQDFLAVFAEILQKCCQPLCMAWLEEELCLVRTNPDTELLSLLANKLNASANIIQNIRKSGKEDLYAELIYALKFGSSRKDSYYNCSLFIQHGVDILEDLLITLSDGVANMYLELISVDSSMSNEMNNLGLSLCTLSTRSLQRLRNEVALHEWVHQNMASVASMYEDRFDLCTFRIELIEKSDEAENFSWWKKLSFRRAEESLSSLRFIAINYTTLPVKRTKELRALIGWRYYFSLFLELSDIGMPFVKTIIGKVSEGISFFLVCLIGRSLGLIYSGIRQSLRWK